MSEFPDFQPYLKSICDCYQKWWQLYTLTDAAGKEWQSKSELQSPFDFGLMVQPLGKENRDPREEEKETTKPFPVLEGIRKYADQHVLLVGRPGSGKSTTLARLLLELAEEMLADVTDNKAPTTICAKSSGNGTAQAAAPRTLTHAERQRLEKRCQDLQAAWNEATEKLSRLRQAWVIETDVADKFKLEKQIQAEEAAIQQWEDDLSRIEQTLSSGTVSTLQTTFSGQIPVLVELRAWQTSVLDLIRNACKRFGLYLTIEQIQTMLDECQFILLMDGLNELPCEAARTDVFNFRHNHSRLPMIFTTRDLSLGGDLGIEKQLEMQSLTLEQMRKFIRSYVPEQAEQMLRQLKDRLRELGQTPLLLWMLCQLFQQTGEIPENLGMVFRLFTQGYERNLKQDVVIESDRAWWKPVLQQLAWVMMQGEKPTEFRVAISREEAVRAISQFLNGKVPYAEDFARKCLRDLQKHHLIQAGTNSEELEFRHQLIQEYYAAEALLDRLPELDDEQLKQEYLNFLKWTEPVALMLALVDEEAQAVQAVKLALEVDWMLGARLAGEVNQEYQDKTQSLVTALNTSKALKIKLLDEMRSDVAIEALHIALEDEETLCLSLEALGRIGSDKAICKISQAVDSQPSSVQSLAVRVLEKIDSTVAISQLNKIASNADTKIKHEINRVLERRGVKSKATSPSQRTKRRKVSVIPKVSKREKLERFVEMLKGQERETVTTVLLTTLDIDDPQEIEVLVLGLLGCERVIPQLVHTLEDKNEEESIRELAVLALSNIGTPDAIDGVIQALEDEEIFEIAAEVLIQLANELALPGLLQLLEKEDLDTDFYTRVAKAVLEIESEDAVGELSQALQHEKFDISWAVADVLKAAGKEHLASRELYEKMKDIDYYERCQAAIVLGYLGEVRAIPTLITAIDYAIDYDDPDLCWKAIYVLRKFSDHPIAMSVFELAAQSLIELILESRFSDATVEAIEALGSLGSPQTLTEFWQHSSSSLKFLNVIKAIQKKWKFYSYEIAQAYLEAQKADRQDPQNNGRLTTITYNIEQVGNFNARDTTIHGNQTGGQTL